MLDGRVRPEIPGPAHNVPADADGWGLIDQLGAWDCMEVWVEAIWYCSCLVLRMRKEPSLHFQIVPKIGNYIHFVESNSVVIFLRLSLLSSNKVLRTCPGLLKVSGLLELWELNAVDGGCVGV